jgi:hypothetical protein
MTSKTSALELSISKLFGQNGQPFSMDTFSEKLRWKANRILPQLGWPGMLAIGLLMMLIPFYFSTLRPLQASLDAKLVEVKVNRDHFLQSSVVDHSLDTPSEQLTEFYKFFPAEKTSPHWLGLMMDIANKRGLSLNHGEYAVVRDSMGELRRIKITLPVQGTYPQIRQYLAELIEQVPSMSLENVQFERKDIIDTDLQAKVKLVLYLRHPS